MYESWDTHMTSPGKMTTLPDIIGENSTDFSPTLTFRLFIKITYYLFIIYISHLSYFSRFLHHDLDKYFESMHE